MKYSNQNPLLYLAPGTPAVGSYIPQILIVGPEPVPVTAWSGSRVPGLVHVTTPLGNLTVPTGQGYLLPVK